MIKIYGCSDDYVIIKGEHFSRQFDLSFGEECRVIFADGTSFSISYGNQERGTWDVTELRKGERFVELIPFESEDSANYSDIVIMEECDCLAPKLMKCKK